MHKSWQSGRMVETPRAETIADGIAVRIPVPVAVDDMRGLVDEILLVNDSQIINAMRQIAQHTGQLVEPAGAVSLAGVMAHKERFKGKSVAVVISGGNITTEQVIRYGLIRHES